MARPPSSVGAVHETRADRNPAVAVTPVGAAGTAGASGVTAPDSADAGASPAGLDAVTLKVYCCPEESPFTTAVVAGGVPVTVVLGSAVVPTYGVTTYLVAGPPVAGAVHVTVADSTAGVALTLRAA